MSIWYTVGCWGIMYDMHSELCYIFKFPKCLTNSRFFHRYSLNRNQTCFHIFDCLKGSSIERLYLPHPSCQCFCTSKITLRFNAASEVCFYSPREGMITSLSDVIHWNSFKCVRLAGIQWNLFMHQRFSGSLSPLHTVLLDATLQKKKIFQISFALYVLCKIKQKRLGVSCCGIVSQTLANQIPQINDVAKHIHLTNTMNNVSLWDSCRQGKKDKNNNNAIGSVWHIAEIILKYLLCVCCQQMLIGYRTFSRRKGTLSLNHYSWKLTFWFGNKSKGFWCNNIVFLKQWARWHPNDILTLLEIFL